MRQKLNIICLLTISMLFSWTEVSAEVRVKASTDSLCQEVYFPQGVSKLNFSFHGNGEHLSQFVGNIRQIMADSTLRIQPIHVTTGSSLEGGTNRNVELSALRGESIKNYLKGELNLPDSMFRVESLGEDWQGLRELVIKNRVPHYRTIVQIIDSVPRYIFKDGVIVDGKKKRLMDLCYGRVWNYLLKNVYPSLRVGRSMISCPIIKRGESLPMVDLLPLLSMAAVDTVIHPSADLLDPGFCRKPLFAIKTNLLYDAALVPAIGIDVPVAKHWVVGAEGYFAWWSFKDATRFWRIYGGDIHGRYYFGKEAFHGHHVGVYGGAVCYDIKVTDGTGSQGKPNYYAGVDYGYAFRLAKNLYLDCSIGIGYLWGHADNYVMKKVSDLIPEVHKVWTETVSRSFFGPTKAEVSLQYVIGHKVTRKGGRK